MTARLKLLGAIALTVLCAFVPSLLAKVELPSSGLSSFEMIGAGERSAPSARAFEAPRPTPLPWARTHTGPTSLGFADPPDPLEAPDPPAPDDTTPGLPIHLPSRVDVLPLQPRDAVPLHLPAFPNDDDLRAPVFPDPPPLHHYPVPSAPAFEGPSPFHLGVLGVLPILTAMLLVELLAAAVPRWRSRRHGGPRARAPFVRATFLLAGVLAIVQAFGIAAYARGMGYAAPGMGPTLGLIALALLGVGLHLGAMWLCSRFGVANGFVVFLIVLAIPVWLPQLLKTWGAEDREHAWHLILLGVAATIAVLTLRPEGRPLPLTGLLPLTALAQVAALVGLVAGLVWLPFLDELTHPPAAVQTILVGVLALGMPWLALRRRARLDSSRASPASRGLPGNAGRSIALSAAYIALLYVANNVAAPHTALVSVATDFILIATTTAGLWDILAELDARWRLGPLVPAWPFYDVEAAERVLAALQARGVPAFLRTHRLHTLVRILGPWFPSQLMVPPASLELARALAEADHAQPALAAAAEALA